MQHGVDAELTAVRLAASDYLDFVDTPVAGRITTLKGNSTAFDFSGWKEAIDVALIDGGHDLETVTTDTENALKMITKSRPSCVLWHDYGNPEYPDLTKYLDHLAGRINMVHVEETMLCLHFHDKDGSLLKRMLQR